MQGITGVDDKRRLIFALVPSNYYLANSCNYILANSIDKLKYLLGILNSFLLNWVFKKNSTNSNVNCYEINCLPILVPSSSQQETIVKLVDSILEKYTNGTEADIPKIDKCIDNFVYRFYNLTYNEVKIIEPDFALSRAEYEEIS